MSTIKPIEAVEHSWSDTGIYEVNGRRIAMLTISDEATEDNQEELESRMREDARRLAASWNWCIDIPTDKLESKSIDEYVTEQAFLTGMAPAGDAFGFGLNGLACQMLAASFAGQFVGSGAVNFLEVNMSHPEMGPFTVTIQRHHGKTPAQMKAEVEQQLEAERASLFAENQRKQQLEARVNELESQERSWRVAYLDERKTANKLLEALKGLMEIHDNPAPFSGKTGEDRILMLERQAAKTHTAVSAACAAIAAVEGGQP